MKAETKDELSESALARKLMLYTGKFAYPTVVLFAIATSVYIGSSILGGLDVWPLWISTIVNAVCAYLLFTPLHEATHQNIKGKHGDLNWLEEVIGWISGLSLLAPFPLFRYLHITHHRHTNHPEKDPDYWVAGNHPVLIFLRCLTTYMAYIVHYFKSSGKLLSDPEMRQGYIISISVLLLLHIPIIWYGQMAGWAYPIMIHILPAYIALGFLSFAFDWLPHHPHAVQKRYLDTRIMLKPGLSTILVSQNMHLIHHLYSGIPYYHYGDALKVLAPKLRKEGARIES